MEVYVYMCIAIIKPKGIPCPNMDTLKNCFVNNPDGAGIAYQSGNQYQIHKGFMKWTEFESFYEKLQRKINLKNSIVVYHFRITTHGGTKPEFCHPFPLTDNVKELSKKKVLTDILCIHNGIIHLTDYSLKISDTMEYIRQYLFRYWQIDSDFYNNPKIKDIITKDTAGGRFAILKENNIFTFGNWITEKGIYYSNDTYKAIQTWYTDIKYTKEMVKQVFSRCDDILKTLEQCPENIKQSEIEKLLFWLDDLYYSNTDITEEDLSLLEFYYDTLENIVAIG